MIPTARAATYVSRFRPASAGQALLYDAVTIAGGSLLVAALARVAVRLPFSPVPVTGQTLGVLLVALLLGRSRAVAAILCYLAEGAVGLPVSATGQVGLAWILGPTGGYLVGFVGAALTTGWLADRGWTRGPVTTALAAACGNVVIYLCGMAWLSRFVGVGRVIALGLLPFIAGDVVKATLAAMMLPAGWRVIRLLRPGSN